MRAFRIILGAGLVVAAGLAALAGYLGYLHSSGNFHAVVPGEVYRSAQVTSGDIAEYEGDFGIRSILNLRGAHPGSAWYEDEIATAARLGIKHVDFRMSATEELGAEDAAQLIALMRDLPKPLLVHCLHGSDRTGLAMSLYMAAISRADEATAERQLSLRFGHWGVPWLSETWPMNQSWERLEADLGFLDS